MNKLIDIIKNFFGFSISGRDFYTPEWLKYNVKTGSKENVNATSKVIHFSKHNRLTDSQLRHLLDIELEYEQSKSKAKHDYPHVKSVLLEEIQKAKDTRYKQICSTLGEDIALKYIHSKKSKKVY